MTSMMNNVAIVRCRVVSGVFSGTRESVLKDENGQVRYFTTLDEADAEARRLTNEMNHRYSHAAFRYWAEEC